VPKEIKSLLTALGPAVPFPCQFSPCIRIGKTQFSRSRAKSKTANRRLPKTMIHQTIWKQVCFYWLGKLFMSEKVTNVYEWNRKTTKLSIQICIFYTNTHTWYLGLEKDLEGGTYILTWLRIMGCITDFPRYIF
jgi:hypothetical protein